MDNKWIVACLDVWEPDVQEATRAVAPPEFELLFARSFDESEQLALARECDFLMPCWAPVPAAMIAHAPKARMVHKWGIGVDKIDLDACRKAGIPVLITAGANKGPVAEHTIMLMLAIYRQLSRMDRGMRSGKWLKKEARSMTFRLDGKTVGLVGFGNIGREVARKIRGFGVRVLYYDIVRPEPALEKELGVSFAPFETLLAESDIVSMHVPLTEATHNMLDARAIGRMKDGAVAINCARGEVVDADALHAALTAGKLLGAGIDVWPEEPVSPEHPLLRLENVAMTPHIAGAAYDNVGHVSAHAFRNMLRLIRGEPLPDADVIVRPGR